MEECQGSEGDLSFSLKATQDMTCISTMVIRYERILKSGDVIGREGKIYMYDKILLH